MVRTFAEYDAVVGTGLLNPRAFCLVKPGFEKDVPEIINRICNAMGVDVIAMVYHTLLTKAQAADLYREHEDKDFFGELVDYMSSNVLTVIELKSNKNDIQSFHGPMETQSNFCKSLKEELRKEFGVDDMRNAVHSPDGDAPYSEIVRQLRILRKGIRRMSQTERYMPQQIGTTPAPEI